MVVGHSSVRSTSPKQIRESVVFPVVAHTFLHHEQPLASTPKPACIVLSGAVCSAEGPRPELGWIFECFYFPIAKLACDFNNPMVSSAFQSNNELSELSYITLRALTHCITSRPTISHQNSHTVPQSPYQLHYLE